MTKELNRVEKLISELCPDGVDWMTLGDVCIVGDGNHSSNYPKSSEMVNEGVPFIRGTNMHNGTIYDKDMKYITEEKHQILAKGHLQENDVLFMNRGEIGKTAIIPKNFANSNLNSQLAWLRSKQEILVPKYLFFILNTPFIQDTILSEGGALKQFTIRNLKLVKIPIPPLPIQQEIVSILDKFTELEVELEVELEAELEARKKQYEYYRYELLTLEDRDVEWRTLGEIANYRRGSFPQPYGELKWYGGDGAMPFVQVVDVGFDMRLVLNTKQRISKLAQSKSVFVPAGTVIVTLQGSIGRVAITQYDSYVDRTLAIFENYKIEINKKYFAYQLEKKFGVEKEKARGSTIKTITKEELTKFKIPLPPLKEQARIVSLLDKFSLLVNDISIGLPAELNARRQQYKYYRNKLLTFKEKPNE